MCHVYLPTHQREGDNASTSTFLYFFISSFLESLKVAPPFRVVELDILFGSGIDTYGCLLDAAENVGVVERKGSWYNKGETRFAQGNPYFFFALLVSNSFEYKKLTNNIMLLNEYLACLPACVM